MKENEMEKIEIKPTDPSFGKIDWRTNAREKLHNQKRIMINTMRDIRIIKKFQSTFEV